MKNALDIFKEELNSVLLEINIPKKQQTLIPNNTDDGLGNIYEVKTTDKKEIKNKYKYIKTTLWIIKVFNYNNNKGEIKWTPV